MYLIDDVRKKLDDGQVLVGANVLLGDPEISEIFGLAGCDFVWIDMEHAPLTHKEVEMQIIGAHAGNTAAFVRIPWNDAVMVKRVIDMGPDGIIFPFIRSYEEAAQAVSACRFPPNGVRGWNPLRALKYGLEDQDWYAANAEKLMWRIMMIEHIDAVNDIDRILDIPEIDAIMIGPSDMSASMGHMLKTDTPDFWEAIQKVTDSAKRHNKVIAAAVPTNCPSDKLNKWLSYGVRMVSIGQDEFLLSSIVRDNVRSAKQIYANFKG